MQAPEAIGWVVRAYEDPGCKKQHHSQEFLFKDHGAAEAEVKARQHHKHIRDLYPESHVELAYVFADQKGIHGAVPEDSQIPVE